MHVSGPRTLLALGKKLYELGYCYLARQVTATYITRKVLRWCWHNFSCAGYQCGGGAGGAALTLGAACSWDSGGSVGHSDRGRSMFHKGGETSGGVWVGTVSVSVGGGTLGAAVESSVGVAGGGATLGAWGESALGAGSGSSLRSCHRSCAGDGAGAGSGAGAGAGSGATLGDVVACV